MKLERLAIAVLLVIVAGQAIASCVEGRGRRQERLAAANSLADATAQGEWFKGQWRVTFRYLHQAKVELDETQRERDQQAKLAATFRLEAQELRGKGTASAPTFAGDTATLFSEFGRLDSTGFHIATLTRVWPVRPAPIQSDILYRVELAPVPLQVGFACVGPNARFYVTGPRNRPLVLERGTVSADVCNPPPPPYHLLSLRPPSLPWLAIVFGAGILAGAAITR